MAYEADNLAQTFNAASTRLMGCEVLNWDRDTETLTMRFTAPPEFGTPRGAVQGGLIAGFLDEVMGAAVAHATKGEAIPLNLDMNLTFLKLVPIGTFTGTGRIVRRGKRVIFLEGELHDDEGNLLSRATSTAIPTPKPQPE